MLVVERSWLSGRALLAEWFRALLAEWFEAFDFEPGKPGSNPSLVKLFRKKVRSESSVSLLS